jgi:hypothetical protein
MMQEGDRSQGVDLGDYFGKLGAIKSMGISASNNSMMSDTALFTVQPDDLIYEIYSLPDYIFSMKKNSDVSSVTTKPSCS